MNRKILYFLTILIYNFFFIKEQLQEGNFGYIETTPVSTYPFIENVKDKLLLTEEQIQDYNKIIKTKTNSLYDIENLYSLSKEEILKYIKQYSLPTLPKYNNEEILTVNNTQYILDNRNIENVENKENLSKGIVVKRSNLRSFPTSIPFYDQKGSSGFDRLQETELVINTPVVLLHESKDQLWYFVLSPIYAGWVLKENIALASEEDWSFFIKNASFGIITDSILEIEGEIFDMGVSLPFVGVNEGYQFVLPIKNEKNTVSKKIITIPRDKAHIGYLPYTEKNIVKQAFKYENVPYRWGGKDDGVDCSSFVMNVYKTFGFLFPRNTSTQQGSIGRVIFLSNVSQKEKQEFLLESGISLLYQKGHVMVYLGEKEGKGYIIHASGSDEKVITTKLENSSYLSKIDRIVKIP